jgi:hypothetical protein
MLRKCSPLTQIRRQQEKPGPLLLVYFMIDPVFAKTSQNARFLLSENERFGLVFAKTGSINSGTGGTERKPYSSSVPSPHRLFKNFSSDGSVSEPDSLISDPDQEPVFLDLVRSPVPEFIDPVFTKTSPKRSFSVIQNERFGLVFAKTGSIISGTGIDFQPGGPERQPYLSYRLARLHRLGESIPRNSISGLINVYKYGLWVLMNKK